jgi:hypothetical protein
VTGGIIPHDEAEIGCRHLQQVLQMLLDFLVPFARIQLIEALTRGILDTPQQVPHLIFARGVYLYLTPGHLIDPSEVRTPVEVCFIKEEKPRFVVGNDDNFC